MKTILGITLAVICGFAGLNIAANAKRYDHMGKFAIHNGTSPLILLYKKNLSNVRDVYYNYKDDIKTATRLFEGDTVSVPDGYNNKFWLFVDYDISWPAPFGLKTGSIEIQLTETCDEPTDIVQMLSGKVRSTIFGNIYSIENSNVQPGTYLKMDENVNSGRLRKKRTLDISVRTESPGTLKGDYI